MNTMWLSSIEYLDEELRQSHEEGKKIDSFIDRITEVKSLPQKEQKLAAEEILDEIRKVPVEKDFPYKEPSLLEDIRAEASKVHDDFEVDISKEEMHDKIYGAWLGRCAGCFLGKPVESYAMEKGGHKNLKLFLKGTDSYPLKQYFNFQHSDEVLKKYGLDLSLKKFDPRNLKQMPEDDDINYTVVGLWILKRYGRDFKPEDVGEGWLSAIPIMHTCTAERVAYRNLVNLIFPPESAIHHNPYREWIGAQIRADMWGYINPGNPELAAEFAWRDACISHVKNGIYGAMFVASMLSAAYVTKDVEVIIQAGLSQIPSRSRLSEAVADVLSWWKQDKKDWEKAVDLVYKKYGNYHPVHTINNALLVCIGLLFGELDFGKSVSISVMGGWDTDCNGATVGSIVGLILGAAALPEKWIQPFNDRLETGVNGFNHVAISTLAKETAKFMGLTK